MPLSTRLALAAGVACVVFFVIAFALLALPSIPDTDSYYHLAVARLYGQHGFVDKLEWARFSVMRDGFGDKEPLFHVLLIPFSSDPTLGRIAVALFNALFAGVLTFVVSETLGVWCIGVAPLLYLTAPYFWSRAIRLRPELLSVTLMIAVAYAALRKRPVAAFVLSMLFAWSHTAWHALAGLAVLWLIATRSFKTCAAILAGIAAGLVVHPHFPFNLKIWYLQNVVSIVRGAAIGMSTENARPPILSLIAHNAGWFLLALVAAFRARPGVFYSIPAAIFAVMQLLWERMSTYFFPFATLALVPAKPKRWFAIVTLVAVALSAPFTLRSMSSLRAKLPADVEHDWAEFGKHVPPGAHVAAQWGATDAYVYFAPQGRYLNVLDPSMMLAAHPREYWVHRRMFEGSADIVASAKLLDSDYVAFARWEATPAFLARVRADPRLERVYDGYNVLLAVKHTSAR